MSPLIAAAVAASRKGLHEEALSLLAAAERRGEEGAALLRAQAAAGLGRTGEALASCRRARRLRPRDPRPRLLLAHLERLAGRPGPAERALREAARLGGGAPAFAGLSELLFARARPAEALATAERALKLAPADAAARRAAAAALGALAEAALRAGGAPRAVELLDRAAALAPLDASASLLKAQALRVAGRHEEALPLLEAARPGRPGDLAECALAAGRSERVRTLARALPRPIRRGCSWAASRKRSRPRAGSPRTRGPSATSTS